MKWTRSDVLVLSQPDCIHCRGLGFRHLNDDSPCNCVLRAIFRTCYAQFRYCSTRERSMSRISLEGSHGGQRKTIWSRKNEEYVADFCLISRRSLGEFEYELFKHHFLLGADWKLCCRKLGIDRGTFFHEVYRIEQRLGRVFRELQPYALFPLDEYFCGSTREVEARPRFRITEAVPIRPPVAA
jgi:hypothetical protein